MVSFYDILVPVGSFWAQNGVPGPLWACRGSPDGIWTLLESISGSPGEPLGHPGVDFGGPWGTRGPTVWVLRGTFAYLGPIKFTKNGEKRVWPKKPEKVQKKSLK